MRIPTRHQYGSARRTLGVLGEGLGEAAARRRKGIDVGRSNHVVAITTHTVGAQLIGEDEDDVG